MDIVSSLPFTLKLIQEYPMYRETSALNFSLDEKEIWVNGFVTLEAEENDEIDLLFDSDDSNARLYLDALDIVPIDDINVQEDEYGKLYRKVSAEKFTLYKSNSDYDALRVDSFKISVLCNGIWYFGVFDIVPKPMSKDEWRMMRDDLEKEIKGLSQDIVRRNTGVGNQRNEDIPLEIVYDFLIIKKYSDRMLMALMDIAENPRYEISTDYVTVSSAKSDKYKFDTKTMRRYANRSASEPTLKVPIKTINYNIQDNRLLKSMLDEYDHKLNQFLELIRESELYAEENKIEKSKQYIISWNDSLREFKTKAEKLKKLSAILKSQDWFSCVGKITEPFVPHSFIMDTRYNLIYQMHLEFNNKMMNVQLDSEFSYTWKQSSYLYEMWSYLKICHFCFEEFEMFSDEWKFVPVKKLIFPFVTEGTTVQFKNNKTKIEVIYDKCLPLDKKLTTHDEPLYIAKHHSEYRNHNRPDILINVYDSEFDMYLGSIIVECKYRKLYSFWNENSKRSSRGQLEAYYNNARSAELFDGLGDKLNIRPVNKVIVLSPDELAGGKEQKDFNIETKTFKASKDSVFDKNLKKAIVSEINNISERMEILKKIFN